jgi:hypothetical protein
LPFFVLSCEQFKVVEAVLEDRDAEQTVLSGLQSDVNLLVVLVAKLLRLQVVLPSRVPELLLVLGLELVARRTRRLSLRDVAS